MKRLRLWVKVVLVIIGAWLLICTWNKLCEWEERDRQNCVAGGHTYEWCVRELSK